MGDFTYAIGITLLHEGGYTVDHAGPTNWGVVLRELQAMGLAFGDVDGDGDIDAEDVRRLPRERAVEYYRTRVWEPGRYGEIRSNSAAAKVFDLAVNMGGWQSCLILQRALRSNGMKVKEDGKLGAMTLGAANAVPGEYLLPALRSEAAGVYRMIEARDRAKFGRFLDGWLRRAYY